MKKIFLLFVVSIISSAGVLKAQDGFHQVKSQHPVAATVARLTAGLEEKGMHIFATIDHQQGAEKAGLDLRPTSLVIFGNPRVGTKLMQCDQRTGLALPLKMLIWQDEQGAVWIGYWEPAEMAAKYGLDACAEVLEKVKNAMANFAHMAAS